jgi:hypothetical protein
MIPALGRIPRLQLLVIRTAMLLGVLLFGAVTWYIKRQEHPAILTPGKAQLFGYIFAGLAFAAVAGLVFLRSRLETTREPGQILVYYVIGYALSEGAAVFGGVVWFLGGAQAWYIAGLVLMVVAFQVLPVEASRE